MRPSHSYALADVIARIAGAATNDAAVGELLELSNNYGVEAAMVGVMRAPETPEPVSWVNTWPEEWFVRYESERLFEIDPVAQGLFSHSRPFGWNDVPRTSEGQRFFDIAAEHNLVDGLMIPILDHGGFVGAVSLGGPRMEHDPSARALLHVASVYAFGRLREGAPLPGYERERRIALSPQQRQVMSLVAIGKSNWEIAKVLSISEATVRFHLATAIRKLGVNGRVAGAVKAYALGLIDLTIL